MWPIGSHFSLTLTPTSVPYTYSSWLLCLSCFLWTCGAHSCFKCSPREIWVAHFFISFRSYSHLTFPMRPILMVLDKLCPHWILSAMVLSFALCLRTHHHHASVWHTVKSWLVLSSKPFPPPKPSDKNHLFFLLAHLCIGWDLGGPGWVCLHGPVWLPPYLAGKTQVASMDFIQGPM